MEGEEWGYFGDNAAENGARTRTEPWSEGRWGRLGDMDGRNGGYFGGPTGEGKCGAYRDLEGNGGLTRAQWQGNMGATGDHGLGNGATRGPWMGKNGGYSRTWRGNSGANADGHGSYRRGNGGPITLGNMEGKWGP
nr:uncharacterized protein LOC113817718 [Penaeus vannamei]